MPDYRTLFERDYVGAWDLDKDATLTIAKVEQRKLHTAKGEKGKPIITFEGAQKGFVVNNTNGKTIAALYGTKTENWIGKKITLYRTTTALGRETVDCIRVRPVAPPEAK